MLGVPFASSNLSLIVQQVRTASSAVTTGSGTIPYDDTIPTSSEGNEFLAVTITPTKASNNLIVRVHAWLSEVFNAGDFISGAIFRDSALEPIEGGCGAIAGSQEVTSLLATGLLVIEARILAGSTAETTFRFRAGCDGGSCGLNHSNGSRRFGGKMTSFIEVVEVAV